jgi:peptidyl-prolyl cis-trans isomerase C
MKRLVLALATLMLTACPQQGSGPNYKHNRDGTGTPVATWNGDSITQEELKQRFAEMSPFARTRYQTAEQRKEYVDGVARFELLAAEAHKRGLDKDPEVIETAKKVMVQRLMQEEFEKKGGPKIEDADVQAYYDKHKTDYVKPEMIRLTHLFLDAPKDSPKRAEKKAEAEALQKRAAEAQPMDFQAFGKLVREASEEPRTKPLDGDMRYLSREELAAQYGAEVAAASDALKEVGQLSGVVETDKGFHILKLQGRQAALNLSLEQVKTQLQSRMLYERRTQSFNDFMEKLKKEQNFQVKQDALTGFEVDLKAPTQEPKGPPPGFMPAPQQMQ